MASDQTRTTEAEVSERPSRIRWIIFTLACLASWLLYLHRYSWGIIKPAFRRENPGINDVEIGWLDSAFQAAYGIGQIPGGLAGDLFGPRATLSLFALVWSLAAAGVAWTGGFWNLIGARAAFGLAQAGAYPVISKITRVWFPLASRTSVQGAVTAMGRVGAAFAPLIIATLMIGVFGLSWQTTLVLLTLPGLFLAVGVWALVRNRPGEHPLVNEAERKLLEDAPPASPEMTASKPLLQLNGPSLVSLSMMLLYIFASTFQDQFYLYWLPSFLQEGKGLSVVTMGLVTPLIFIGGAVGGVLGGFLNDYWIRRTGNRRWSRSLVAFSGKSIAAALVLLSMQVGEVWLVVGVLVAVRIFSDWSLPTQWAAVTDMGGRAAATVFGIVNTAGSLGGFVAGPIFGYLKQEYGWDGVFYGVAGMCAFAAMTWLFLDCTQRLVDD